MLLLDKEHLIYSILMKTLFFIFFTTSTLVQATTSGLRCIPSSRSTGLYITENNEMITLTVQNPMGIEFMPQFEGPLSIADLNFLKNQQEDTLHLGDQFSFSFKKSQCQTNFSNFQVDCDGPSENSLNQFKALSLSTTITREERKKEITFKRKFRLSIEKENIYFLTYEFNLINCKH